MRAAQLNPINIRWPNFVVAEDAGQVVGVGQLRPHTDGSRELASLAVLPEFRKRGIGHQLMQALLAQAKPQEPLYLFCEHNLERYYTRYGFCVVGREALTPPLLRLFRAGSLVTRIGSLFSGHPEHLIAMRRLPVS